MSRILMAATVADGTAMERVLGNEHEFISVSVLSEALAKLNNNTFDLVLVCVHFDQSRMFDLLRELHKNQNDTPVILHERYRTNSSCAREHRACV